jgi:hypothetical protein
MQGFPYSRCRRDGRRPRLHPAAAALGLKYRERARGEQRVLEAGKQYAAGTSTRIPLNPEWDNVVLDTIASEIIGALRQYQARVSHYRRRGYPPQLPLQY